MLGAARLGQRHRLGWDTGTGVFSARWGRMRSNLTGLPAAVTLRPLRAQPFSGLSLSTSLMLGFSGLGGAAALRGHS